LVKGPWNDPPLHSQWSVWGLIFGEIPSFPGVDLAVMTVRVGHMPGILDGFVGHPAECTKEQDDHGELRHSASPL